MNVFEIIIQNSSGFSRGLLVTFQLCFIIWVLGLTLGTLLGFVGSRYKQAIGVPINFIAFFLSGIPVLVFLFWLHYPAQEMLNVVVDPFFTSALTLSIVNIFSVADIVRKNILELPQQYIEAAKVCGIPSKKLFWKIEAPLVLRHAIPSLLLLQVNMLHMTLFASLIAVNEIFRVVQQINAHIYKPIELYSALAIFFLLISLPLNGFANWFKIKYSRNLSEK